MAPGRGTRIAFYAPMKPPHHPVPSGDRAIARNLMAMLTASGAEVQLASELRVYDKQGCADTQARLKDAASQEVARLLRDMPPADLWVTYHNYYKAPDLIGPAVARVRGIPYVQIESTRAQKRLSGDWAEYAVRPMPPPMLPRRSSISPNMTTLPCSGTAQAVNCWRSCRPSCRAPLCPARPHWTDRC